MAMALKMLKNLASSFSSIGPAADAVSRRKRIAARQMIAGTIARIRRNAEGLEEKRAVQISVNIAVLSPT
jgi:hypothetical protein